MTDSLVQIAREKLDQAVAILPHFEIDLWLTFARETSLGKDPSLDLIYPFDVTWHSAFLVHQSGDRTAILGRYDVENAESLGAFSKIVSYDESIRPALIEVLQEMEPKFLGLNFSVNDPAADGLTHGMKLYMDEVLEAAEISPDQVRSAEDFISSLRGQKTGTELEKIRQAVNTTQEIYGLVGEQIKPGVTERQLAQFMKDQVDQRGLDYAWDPLINPAVNTGPDSAIGHAAPSDLEIQPGHLVHFDFGVKQEGFCADLQRMWYVLRPDETEPPEEVLKAWTAVRKALLAGAKALTPGTHGYEVDKAARRSLTRRGFPEYLHGFGHHIGRVAHDGATILGPQWDRYGKTPEGLVEVDNVFAIELGVKVTDHGWVYLEENVRVLENELEWLSTPQTELALIHPE
jgi:Xaa-Pro aminopeptidase